MKLFNIPNLFTLGNLLTGCLGIIVVLRGEYQLAYIYVIISGIFDFFDGFFARILKIKGELGKQLDSLADMVSFGVLPAMVLFEMMEPVTVNEYLPYIAFLIALFAALRLAKFNIDDRQSTHFYGLPTPSTALFITTLHLSEYIPKDTYTLSAISIVISLLMVSDIKLFSLKFSSAKLTENIDKIILLVIFLTLTIFLGWGAIPITIVAYIALSFIKNILKPG